MVRVTIYVEGGGESKELRARCRKGFSKLIEKLGFAGRMPKIVACGGRNEAFTMFYNSITSSRNDEFPLLLVDSEDPITTSGPWDHLMVRDGWNRPIDAEDDQAQMMVTCMETWIMADHATLRRFFGSYLREGALIPVSGLEMRSRQELLESLKSATNDCGRNRGYDKGKISFQILAELNPESLNNLPYFCRFKETLGRYTRS